MQYLLISLSCFFAHEKKNHYVKSWRSSVNVPTVPTFVITNFCHISVRLDLGRPALILLQISCVFVFLSPLNIWTSRFTIFPLMNIYKTRRFQICNSISEKKRKKFNWCFTLTESRFPSNNLIEFLSQFHVWFSVRVCRRMWKCCCCFRLALVGPTCKRSRKGGIFLHWQILIHFVCSFVDPKIRLFHWRVQFSIYNVG